MREAEIVISTYLLYLTTHLRGSHEQVEDRFLSAALKCAALLDTASESARHDAKVRWLGERAGHVNACARRCRVLSNTGGENLEFSDVSPASD